MGKITKIAQLGQYINCAIYCLSWANPYIKTQGFKPNFGSKLHTSGQFVHVGENEFVFRYISTIIQHQFHVLPRCGVQDETIQAYIL